jgi:amidase
MKDCFDFKPGWVTTFGGVRGAQELYVTNISCMFTERMEKAGAVMVGKTNSPALRLPRHLRQLPVRTVAQPVRSQPRIPAARRAVPPAQLAATASCPMCEGTDGGGSIRIPASWCGVYRLQAGFRPRAAMVTRPDAFGGDLPLHLSRARSPARSRTAALGDDGAPAATIHAIPTASRFEADYHGALPRSIAGKKIAYTRDYGVFPVDKRVMRCDRQSGEGLRRGSAPMSRR